MRRTIVAALLFLLVAAPARAGGPELLVGAAEDAVKQATLVQTKARLDLLRLAGFQAVRVSAIWAPGLSAPSAEQQDQLSQLAAAAKLAGVRVLVTVMQFGSRTTPLSDGDQSDFTQFAAGIARQEPTFTDFIVGNEPNLNRFWLPQFGADGGDVAAVAYERLLARVYDALKQVSTAINVIGGAVSPRGGDRPGTGRDTHSPTAFILDLGKAYRDSGRQLPIMDEFAIHPYEDNSSVPPTATHPTTTTITIADYDKLVSLLGQAFDGTSQQGSTLPIVYGEFGVEAQIPAAKSSLYTGNEPATVKPVDEKTQGSYYEQALGMAFCQPNVRTFLLFHAFDETDLDRWQSGIFYADGTPKESVAAFREGARATLGGVIARCRDLALTPSAKVVYATEPPLSVQLTCDIDCNVYARLERLPRRTTTLAISRHVLADSPMELAFAKGRLRPGRYRFTVRLTAPVNVGPPRLLRSAPINLK